MTNYPGNTADLNKEGVDPQMLRSLVDAGIVIERKATSTNPETFLYKDQHTSLAQAKLHSKFSI